VIAAAVIGLLIVLLLLGMPLAFALGAVTILYMVSADVHLAMLAQTSTARLDSFLILAIPFFYLAGELMNGCKLTDRIVAMAKALVGHIPGGLAQVNIVASAIFAGMSGSATADTAALGSVMIPAMKKEGYPPEFAAAVTVASAMVGPIIPPSVAVVIYGALANVSVGRLLLAGVLPGLLIVSTQMAFTHVVAKRRGYPRHPRASMREVVRASWHGSAAVLFPVLIVGGILSGVFTPTESAAVGVIYAVVLGLLVYRNVSLAELWQTFQKVAMGSVRILLIVALASSLSWIMVREQVPQDIARLISGVTDNPLGVLFIMIALLLAVGLFMVASSALIVLTPILAPVVVSFGIDPVHFGVLMVFVLIIGGGTPPVGVLLFVAQDIAEVPFSRLIRAMMPYYAPLFLAVVLLTVFPQITLWLPNLVYGP